MKETFSSVFSLVLATGLFELLLQPHVLPAATPCDPPIAQMVSAQGNVVVRRAGKTQSQPARLNEAYCPGRRKPQAHRRPVGSSRKGAASRIAYGRAPAGCRPMGPLLSTGRLFPARGLSGRTTLGGHGSEFS